MRHGMLAPWVCVFVATVRMDLIVLGLGQGEGSTQCSVARPAMCFRCSVTDDGPWVPAHIVVVPVFDLAWEVCS